MTNLSTLDYQCSKLKSDLRYKQYTPTDNNARLKNAAIKGQKSRMIENLISLIHHLTAVSLTIFLPFKQRFSINSEHFVNSIILCVIVNIADGFPLRTVLLHGVLTQ